MRRAIGGANEGKGKGKRERSGRGGTRVGGKREGAKGERAKGGPGGARHAIKCELMQLGERRGWEEREEGVWTVAWALLHIVQFSWWAGHGVANS